MSKLRLKRKGHSRINSTAVVISVDQAKYGRRLLGLLEGIQRAAPSESIELSDLALLHEKLELINWNQLAQGLKMILWNVPGQAA